MTGHMLVIPQTSAITKITCSASKSLNILENHDCSMFISYFTVLSRRMNTSHYCRIRYAWKSNKFPLGPTCWTKSRVFVTKILKSLEGIWKSKKEKKNKENLMWSTTAPYEKPWSHSYIRTGLCSWTSERYCEVFVTSPGDRTWHTGYVRQPFWTIWDAFSKSAPGRPCELLT